MKVQRWNPVSIAGAYGLYADVMLTDDGNYVLYADYTQREADHAAEVEGLRREVESLRSANAEWNRTAGAVEDCKAKWQARAEAAERELEKVSAWLRESDIRLGAAVLACNKAERERNMLAESIRNVIKAYDLGEHATTGSSLLDEIYAEVVAVLRTELGSYS